jgi:glutaminyl-peptide cyclotransferase
VTTYRRALGLLLLAAGGACGGESSRPVDDAQPPSTPAPPPTPSAPSTGTPTYSGVVVQRYPHDVQAYTQGLFFVNGQLYESTGVVGQSDLRKVDLRTGAVERRRGIPAPFFGEGSVELGGRIYMLTWREQRAFVFDLATLEPRDTLTYPGEGWGLTTDGTTLYMSDGTARIRVLDPRTFTVRRTFDVKDGDAPVSQLNELEWVNGELYANIWYSDRIARIDPTTGKVVGWIDLAGLLPASQRGADDHVLNGIAYDTVAKKLYVTGKRWPTLFEIRLEPR